MASIKLNNAIRERLLAKLIDGKFTEEKKSIIDRLIALADACYNMQYDPAVRRKMNALPDGWLSYDDGLHVRFGSTRDGYVELDFNGYDSREMYRYGTSVKGLEEWPVDRDTDFYRRFPHKDRGQCRLALDDDHPLSMEYFAIQDVIKDHKERELDLKRKITSVLNSVTTTGRLVQVWPEVEDHVAVIDPGVATGVPAIRVEELNTALGLGAA